MPTIFGRNPIIEALNAGQLIDKIYLQTGIQKQTEALIYRLAKHQNIPVVKADKRKMDQISHRGNHQGVLALIPPVHYIALENLIEKIQRSGKMGSLVIPDRIQDPHNFGAIIRSAEALGVDGLVFSMKGGVPLTDIVVKASSGAVFHLDICKVNSLASAIKYIKQCGFWVYAAAIDGNRKIWEIDFRVSHVIIIGSEGLGIQKSILKESDATFQIPQAGKTASLNASVAAGIILAEIFRQRQQGTG